MIFFLPRGNLHRLLYEDILSLACHILRIFVLDTFFLCFLLFSSPNDLRVVANEHDLGTDDGEEEHDVLDVIMVCICFFMPHPLQPDRKNN